MMRLRHIGFFLIDVASISAMEPVFPDNWKCSSDLGFSLLNKLPACFTAHNKMPAGSETMQFTSHAAGEHVPGWVLLPLVYRDDDENPTCTIGINIHGHSIKDIYVPLSYNDLASMVYSLIDHCVAPMNQGGIMTYGLPFVTYMMRNRPVTYHSRFPYNPSHREAWGGESEFGRSL